MNQTAVKGSCLEGFLFDAKTQSCKPSDQARCVKSCPSVALSSFSYDNTCNKYVLCFAGTPVIQKCADGLQYNSETDRCDFPQFVDCANNMCTVFNDVANITFLRSKAACDKYFICVNGMTINRKCSKGLQFNLECNCCDFTSKVNCTIPALKRNIVPLSRAPPKVADIKCPENGINFYSHANEDKYYFCVKGRGVIMDCTPGLVYDPKKKTCREKKNIISK